LIRFSGKHHHCRLEVAGNKPIGGMTCYVVDPESPPSSFSRISNQGLTHDLHVGDGRTTVRHGITSLARVRKEKRKSRKQENESSRGSAGRRHHAYARPPHRR
jgi:hypothetical protein